MTLSDILTDDRSGIIASLCTGDLHCKPIGKAMIQNVTFYPAKHITGICIFLDPDDNVLSAQMSTYTPDEGLRCHLLDSDLHISETL